MGATGFAAIIDSWTRPGPGRWACRPRPELPARGWHRGRVRADV